MKGERAPTQAASRPPSAHQKQRRRLRAAVVRDTEGYASLREEWDGLYRSCPSATPFSSWEWLYSWWEAYEEGHYGLRLITLRNESGLLVGLLPLMMARRGLLLGDGARILY
jgi:CelD/BcsL family acetyltransferase involved in cellulose biosynthesis